MHPYRKSDHPEEAENELWLRLDWALEEALRDPCWAWGVAWQVAKDAGGSFPEVRDAAAWLMATLQDDL